MAIIDAANAAATEQAKSAGPADGGAAPGESQAKPQATADDWDRILAGRAKLNSRQTELDRRAAELDAKAKGYTSIDELRKKVAENPLETLEKEFGVPYSRLADAKTKQTTPAKTEEQLRILELQTKLDKTTAELNDRFAKAEESQGKAALEQATAELETWRSNSLAELAEIKDLELVHALNAGPRVIKLIEDAWDKNQTVVKVADAAKFVEQQLDKEFDAQLEAALKDPVLEKRILRALEKKHPKTPTPSPFGTARPRGAVTVENDKGDREAPVLKGGPKPSATSRMDEIAAKYRSA